MISMLRLINPPGHRPRRGWTMPRYMESRHNPSRMDDIEWPPPRNRESEDAFMERVYARYRRKKAASKGVRTRRANQRAVRSKWLSTREVPLENPPRRRRRKTTRTTKRTTILRRDRQGRFLKKTTVRRTVVKNPRTKGVSKMKRRTTTHRRRTRRNPVAANPRRRRVVRRARTTARRNPYRGATKAYRTGYGAEGPVPSTGITVKRKRKTKRTKRTTTRKAAPARRRRRKATVARKRVTHRVFRPRRHRGKVVGGLSMQYTPQSRRRAVHKVRRTVGRIRDRKGRSHSYFRYSVSRNPGTTMKNMLMDGAALYGGFVGAKIVAGLLDQYVLSNASIKPAMDKIGQASKIVSPVIGFVLAAFAGKLIPQPKVVSSLQTGATLALFQAVVKNLIPPTALVSLPPAVAGALSGIDDMGFRGYGEYLQPRRQLGEYIQQRPQLGAYVQEAMALDEYVQDPGGMHGFDVQEALADSEVQGMQSGFAAGSLAKTVFSNY